MFIFTARLDRRRIFTGAAALMLLCTLTVLAVTLWRDQAVSASAAADAGHVRTNEDRIAYLGTFGWEVAPEPASVEELLIPEEFDEMYTQYVALQSEQGFDLTQYKGKRVKRYTYEITNYPTGETGVLAGLLIYRDKIVGGDVLSSGLNGFLHGLSMP